MYYDIIIVGSGISGLFAAYNIQKMSPSTSFIILEKYKKKWIGGRVNNEMFYGTQIVTGAGIGRKKRDKILIDLLDTLKLPYKEFNVEPYYSTQIDQVVDIKKIMQYLKNRYKKNNDQKQITFKEFSNAILGDKLYNDFLVSAGYTDYENADAFDVLYNYGMSDNACCWTGLHIDWKQLVETLENEIGIDKIKTSMNVVSITKIGENQEALFQVATDRDCVFQCKKVIVATTIDSIKKIVPGAANKNSIYNGIQGQTFLRLYGKFTKKSTETMKNYIKGYTIVPGPLQKIIPMNADKGVYMIAYSDNKSAIFLRQYLENIPKNRDIFCGLIERALGIPDKTLELIAIKEYYWPIGTHYYLPLPDKYRNRAEFIYKAQHPENDILVIGEVVSSDQGWVNGALSSVTAVLNKKWLTS